MVNGWTMKTDVNRTKSEKKYYKFRNFLYFYPFRMPINLCLFNNCRFIYVGHSAHLMIYLKLVIGKNVIVSFSENGIDIIEMQSSKENDPCNRKACKRRHHSLFQQFPNAAVFVFIDFLEIQTIQIHDATIYSAESVDDEKYIVSG